MSKKRQQKSRRQKRQEKKRRLKQQKNNVCYSGAFSDALPDYEWKKIMKSQSVY